MTTPVPPTPVPSSSVTSALKPGYKTTELLVVILTDIGLVAASAASWLPPRYAALGSTIAAAAYAASRGLAKLYPPKPSN